MPPTQQAQRSVAPRHPLVRQGSSRCPDGLLATSRCPDGLLATSRCPSGLATSRCQGGLVERVQVPGTASCLGRVPGTHASKSRVPGCRGEFADSSEGLRPSWKKSAGTLSWPPGQPERSPRLSDRPGGGLRPRERVPGTHASKSRVPGCRGGFADSSEGLRPSWKKSAEAAPGLRERAAGGGAERLGSCAPLGFVRRQAHLHDSQAHGLRRAPVRPGLDGRR